MVKKEKFEPSRFENREIRLAALLASIDDLIFLLDNDLVFKECFQPRKEKLLKDPEYFIGKHIDDIGFPAPALELIKKSISKTLNTGKAGRAEYYLDLPQGRRWFDLRTSELKNSCGEREGITCVARDITGIKNLNYNLEKSKKQLSATLLSIGDGVITTDKKGNISRLNSVAQKLTGWKNSEAKGKPASEIFNIIDSKTRRRTENPIEMAFKQKKPVELKSNTILISREGAEYHIADSCAPIFSEKGQIVGSVMVFRDVSKEHKRREKEHFELLFQKTLADISEKFLTVKEKDFDRAVEDALFKIGSLFGVDRSYIFIFSKDMAVMHNTHEWCARGIESQKERVQDFPLSNMPWWKSRIMKLKPVHIPEVRSLPPEAEKEKKEFLSQKIKSLICLPIFSHDKTLRGFMGFDAVRTHFNWPENHIRMLMVIAEIIAGAFNRREAERGLKESRSRYKSLIKNIPGAPYRSLFDKEWSMLYIGDEIKNLTGYEPDDFIDNKIRSYESIIHPRDREMVSNAIGEAINNNRHWEIEYRLTGNDKSLKWVYEKGRAVPGPEKKLILEGFIHDITDRKNFETALKASEKKYRRLADNISDVVWTSDLNLNLKYVSPSVKKITGDTIDEYLEKSIEKKFPPAHLKKIHRAVRRELQKEKEKDVDKKRHITLEVQHYKSDGSLFWAEMKINLIRDNRGRPFGLQGVTRDISERKCWEEKIKRLAGEQELLLANIDIMVWYLVDPETYGAVNKAYADFLGMDKSLIQHKKIKEVLSAEKAKMCLEGNDRVFNSREKETTDFKVENERGETRIISVTKTPKLNSEGKVDYVVCSGIDITQQQKAQDEIEKSVKARENFISMVSHELRTPLSVIMEGIKIVEDGSCGDVNPEQKKYLGLATKNVDRLGRLINDILDIQKIEEGMMKFKMQLNNIGTAISTILETSRPAAQKKNLKINANIQDDIPDTLFDSDRIMQVLANIVNNALKFTETGEINISARREDNLIKVSVADTGPGIKENDMPRLFQKFEQFEINSQRKTGGTGLGLAICKKIISMHNGSIWAESELGKGTVFYFTLPLLKEKRDK